MKKRPIDIKTLIPDIFNMPEMISPDDVTAKPEDEVTPAAEPTDSGDTTELPESVLKIPAVHALLQGSPPAFFVDSKTKDPDIKTLEKHTKELTGAGIGAFPAQSLPGNVVVFNSLVLPPEEIMKADQEGSLDSIAVPWETLKAEYEKTGDEEAAPAVSAAGVPTGEPAPAGAPPTAGVQSKLMQKRISNLAVGSPTSGVRPGGGRVLNAIVNPAV